MRLLLSIFLLSISAFSQGVVVVPGGVGTVPGSTTGGGSGDSTKIGVQSSTYIKCVDATSTNAYSCTTSPATTPVVGMCLELMFANANNAINPTVNVNGSGAVPITQQDDQAPVSLIYGGYAPLRVCGSNGTATGAPDVWMVDSPGGGGGTYTAGEGINIITDEIIADDAVVQYRRDAQEGVSLACVSATGNATYTCSMTPTLTIYRTNSCVILNTNFANVTTATIDIDSLGAKSILTGSGGALSAGDIPLNKPKLICYDGTNFIIQGSSSGTTVAKNGLYLTVGSTDYLADTMFAATKPAQTGWSWVGSAGTESFGSDGSMVLTGTASATRIRTRSIGASTVAIVAFRCNQITGTADYSSCGVFLRESSTGKGPSFQQNMYGSVSAPYGLNISYQNWVSDTYSGQLFASPSISGTQYVKLDWSTSDVILSTSPDGENWKVSNTTSKASLFTTAPNELAFFMSSQSPANVMVILSLSIS